MVYWCSECEKYHADNYKRHLKYKIVTRKKEPDLFTKLKENFEAFKKQMEKYCKDVDKIKETLGFWAIYIQRKHPYWKIDEDFLEWINEDV